MFEVFLPITTTRIGSSFNNEITEWLDENVGSGSMAYNYKDHAYSMWFIENGPSRDWKGMIFAFKNINHALHFKLTWGGK